MKFQFLRYGTLFLASLVLFIPSNVEAQVRGSERSVLKQTISGTDIFLDYARPSVRGREPLFGGLEKWGHVWTPGANRATKFRFSKDVWINDTSVSAGAYSVWLHLKENDPWVLMLHPDTTLGHLPAPTLDEAYVTVEVHPSEIGFYAETLNWAIDNIRATGAVIQFRWGATLLEFDLRVDPGYIISYEKAEADRYVGTWLLDRSMARPADSVIARRKENAPPERHARIDERADWFDKPEEFRLEYQPESGMLLINTPAEEEMMREWMESQGLDPEFFQSVLISKAAGVFSDGGLMNGELAYAGDFTFWEFEFDDVGIAQVLVQRNARTDKVTGRATRIELDE